MADYCSNCGSPLQDGSLFCEFCRTQATTLALPKEPRTALQAQKDTTKSQQELSSTHLPAKSHQPAFGAEPRRNTRFWIAIGVIVILVISAAVFGGLWKMFRGHHYLGEKVTYIQSTTLPVFHLNITNAAGDVVIEFVDSTYIMNASAKAYGPGIADIHDATEFSGRIMYNGRYQLIEFDSSNGRDDLTYHINIAIAKEARTALTIVASSGDIEVSVKKPTKLTGLNLKASSGDIKVDLGANTTLDCPEVAFEVGSGGVNLGWTDLVIPQDMDWEVHAVSGAIDVEIIQNRLPAIQTLVDFDIEADSGAIAIAYALNSAIGLQMTGSALSGDINLPGGADSYQSVNYASAVLQLHFNLHSSSGDIDVYPS
ncbi:MAG: DUF4097 family beta strand repeat-containing protein [Candidatus Heimdallarchaeota archaeon]